MPFICIGPVCIPWSALIPVLCYLARPVWTRLHPDTQQAFLTRWKAFEDWMQINLWDRLGWKAKRESKPKREAPLPLMGAAGVEALREKLGSVVPMRTEEEWEQAKEWTRQTKLALVVDFTAEWCKPCKAMAPCFERLAREHCKTALFAKVDVDELSDVAEECGVAAMPTFQIFKQGLHADTLTGAREQALEQLLSKSLG